MRTLEASKSLAECAGELRAGLERIEAANAELAIQLQKVKDILEDLAKRENRVDRD